ncbi:MAG: hypothetical protein QM820_16705 [Minicystis sp.]
MAVASTAELSTYIIGLAGAARVAQATLSSGTDPMTIQEYRFKANISSSFSVNSETSVGLNIWRLSIQEKITIGYKAEWGLEVECKIVPTVTIS